LSASLGCRRAAWARPSSARAPSLVARSPADAVCPRALRSCRLAAGQSRKARHPGQSGRSQPGGSGDPGAQVRHQIAEQPPAGGLSPWGPPLRQSLAPWGRGDAHEPPPRDPHSAQPQSWLLIVALDAAGGPAIFQQSAGGILHGRALVDAHGPGGDGDQQAPGLGAAQIITPDVSAILTPPAEAHGLGVGDRDLLVERRPEDLGLVATLLIARRGNTLVRGQRRHDSAGPQ
jgi:hypothetical protein